MSSNRLSQLRATEFKDRLSPARHKIWFAELRLALGRTVVRTALVASILAVIEALLIVFVRRNMIASADAWWCAGGCLAIAISVFVVLMFPALIHSPSNTAAAERLDHATATGNRIATAYELMGDSHQSAMAHMAIQDGYAALVKMAREHPTMAIAPGWPGKFMFLPLVAIVLIACAALVPTPFLRTPNLMNFPRSTLYGVSAAAMALPREAAVNQEENKSIALHENSRAGMKPAKTDTAGGSPAPSAAGDSNDKDVDSSSSGAPKGAATEGATAADAQLAAAPVPLTSNHPAVDENGDPAGSFPSNQASEKAGSLPTGVGSGTHKQAVSDTPGESSQVAGDSKDNDSTASESDKKGDEDKEKKEPGNNLKKDRPGNSGTSASAPGSGGNGRSSGHDAPKKSRGVVPLLQGVWMPDLLQGQSLPGPEERTKIRISPQVSPGDPAPGVAAPARADVEPPVTRFDIPADSLRTVNAYFRRLHQ